MMLWDIIRDWFVQYIFGGVTSTGQLFGGTIGNLLAIDGGSFDEMVIDTTGHTFFPMDIFSFEYGSYNEMFISFGDWLSTTATIITLVLLIIMLLALVRFVVRQVCGLFAKI